MRIVLSYMDHIRGLVENWVLTVMCEIYRVSLSWKNGIDLFIVITGLYSGLCFWSEALFVVYLYMCFESWTIRSGISLLFITGFPHYILQCRVWLHHHFLVLQLCSSSPLQRPIIHQWWVSPFTVQLEQLSNHLVSTGKGVGDILTAALIWGSSHQSWYPGVSKGILWDAEL